MSVRSSTRTSVRHTVYVHVRVPLKFTVVSVCVRTFEYSDIGTSHGVRTLYVLASMVHVYQVPGLQPCTPGLQPCTSVLSCRCSCTTRVGWYYFSERRVSGATRSLLVPHVCDHQSKSVSKRSTRARATSNQPPIVPVALAGLWSHKAMSHPAEPIARAARRRVRIAPATSLGTSPEMLTTVGLVSRFNQASGSRSRRWSSASPLPRFL